MFALGGFIYIEKNKKKNVLSSFIIIMNGNYDCCVLFVGVFVHMILNALQQFHCMYYQRAN